MDMVASFCKENNILLIVDAISSFIADELDMSRFCAAAVITGSQKALAVQPGISLIALSPTSINRIKNNADTCMYLSLKEALKNGERGQTPFTPAVTTILQLNKRLARINTIGINEERKKIASVAEYFRSGIKDLPFEMVSESPSNAVTCLKTLHASAKEIVRILKDEYDIWVCPNGGAYADVVFRIGHIGYISFDDNRKLLAVLHDMNKRGLL